LGPDQGNLDLQVVRVYFDLLLLYPTTSTEKVPDVAHGATLLENASLIQHFDLIVQIVFAAFSCLRNLLLPQELARLAIRAVGTHTTPIEICACHVFIIVILDCTIEANVAEVVTQQSGIVAFFLYWTRLGRGLKTYLKPCTCLLEEHLLSAND
jgi:hypothetical protein